MAIATLLISIFGPALAKWMETCLAERLKKAAKEVGPVSNFGSEGEAALAIIDQAIEDLPRWAKKRREAFEEMKKAAVVDGELRTKPLTAAEKKKVKKLTGGIEPQ